MTFQIRPIAIAAAILLSGAASASLAQEVRRPYIVQLQAEPAASYKGSIAGLPATQPAPGATFDYRSAPVQNYVQYLDSQKGAVLATIANAPVFATYDVVVNGFAAMLTDAEVLTLKMNAAVIDIQADTERYLDTVSTAQFLGLAKAGGLWSQYVGGAQLKGEDMVVGIVDGGIWPENPAFADRVDANGTPSFDPAATLAYTSAPTTFTGFCEPGEGFDPLKHCNNKLVGARFFNKGFNASGRVTSWSDFVSPRDSNIGTHGIIGAHGGHGDHTASTAAGNAGVRASLKGASMGLASGIAPRARVSSYKVCWTYNDPTATDGTNAKNSCSGADTLAGIDAAVKDGVNVINYSISGSQTSSADAVEQAFYRASLANVFVAASAGNAGPANTVAHISPWIATVAASTHDRLYFADLTLGNGSTYAGASTNATPLPNAPLIRAEDAGMAPAEGQAPGTSASLCYSSAAPATQVLLDPAKVAGKIVICTRGDNARLDKSLAVKQAGGVGMILADNGSGLVSEVHAVPTVHVSQADGAAIKAYALDQGSAAQAGFGVFYNQGKPAPLMASFSSRGPNLGDPNVLKPDLSAPGVDIIASTTPVLTAAEHAAVVAGTLVPPASYDSYQGTSMSSPHVAGLALLLKQAHPSWSPAAIKSALMTTTYSTLNDGVAGAANGLLPWAQGAGHVDPNRALDPGLVYDAGKADYVQYQCKVNRTAMTTADCTNFGILDETYNLNLPSITVSAVMGNVTVRRKVSNVGSSSATYSASAVVPGFSAVVTPAQLTLAPGASASFTVKFSSTTAPVNAWQFGSLSWSDGSRQVKIPVSLRIGTAITAPVEISSDKAAGSKVFLVKTGFSGALGSLKGGLKEASIGAQVDMTPGIVTSASLRAACAAGTNSASVKVYNVSIPTGTVLARFGLVQADSGARDDHDIGLLTPAGTWIYSNNIYTNETVQLASPAPGSYKVCVNSWSGAPVMKHRLQSWIVNQADNGGKFVLGVPAKVVGGNNTSIGVSWSGLDPNKRYIGAALFTDAGNVVRGATVLRVDTGSAGIPTLQAERPAEASALAE